MDEMNKLPEEENNEEIKEQGVPTPETAEVSEPIANIPAPKLPIPKLPLIIGGAVAGVAAIAVTVAIILGGNGNQGGTPHQHSYGEWKTVDAPTCLAAGIEERVCECNERETRPVAAQGHTEVVDSAVEPTCISTGLTEGKHCSECDEVITVQDTIPMLAHTYDNTYDEDCNTCGHIREAECAHIETEVIPGKVATCKAVGLTDGEKCKTCGNTIIEQETVPMLAHTYDNTYDEECNVCGHKRDVQCAHAQTEVVRGYDATCTASGLTDGTKCLKCEEVIVPQTVISKLGHIEVIDAAVKPTCIETGLTEGKHCSRCSETLVVQNIIASLGHNEVFDASVPPTCTSTGLTLGKHCTRCSEILVAQTTISALGHSEYVYIYAEDPTCTEKGITEGKYCWVCDTVTVAHEEIPALGHEVVGRVDEATCTTDGYKYLTCSICAELIDTIWLPAQGHNYENNSCNVCGIPQSGLYDAEGNLLASWSDLTNKYGLIISDFLGQDEGVLSKIISQNPSLKTSVKLVIDDRVSSINSYVFAKCDSLMSIIIPSSIEAVTSEAFSGCDSLKEVYYLGTLEQWCEMGKSYLVSCPLFDGVDLYINGELVKNIIIPSSVSKINKYIFAGCNSLESITIPSTVTLIREGAFINCANLKTVYYEGTIEQWCNISFKTAPCNGSDLYINGELIQNLVIPQGITKIPDNAFADCTSLVSVDISESVTTIGRSAFSGCTSLANVALSPNIKDIEDGAFANCKALETIEIPVSLKTIKSLAFYRCTSLSYISFQGAMSEWGDILKYSYWNEDVPATHVQCSDGMVALQQCPT